VITDLDILRERRKRLLQRARLLKRKLDRDLITSLDRDGNGLDKLEFVIGMLTKLELVTWETVEPFLQQFDMLDTDQSGKLTQDDLEKLADIFKEQVDEKEKAKDLQRTSSNISSMLPRMGTQNLFSRMSRGGGKAYKPSCQVAPESEKDENRVIEIKGGDQLQSPKGGAAAVQGSPTQSRVEPESSNGCKQNS